MSLKSRWPSSAPPTQTGPSTNWKPSATCSTAASAARSSSSRGSSRSTLPAASSAGASGSAGGGSSAGAQAKSAVSINPVTSAVPLCMIRVLIPPRSLAVRIVGNPNGSRHGCRRPTASPAAGTAPRRPASRGTRQSAASRSNAMKQAAMPRAAAHAIPRSGPITYSAVDRTSATKALSCQTVTDADRMTGRPLRGSMMWPIRLPSSRTRSRSDPPLVAMEPAASDSSRTAVPRRAGCATPTAHGPSEASPETAIWPPKSMRQTPSRPRSAARTRSSASPLPNPPASRTTAASRVTAHPAGSSERFSNPAPARAASSSSSSGCRPSPRRPQTSMRRPIAGSNAPPVAARQSATRASNAQVPPGSRNASPTGRRFSALRTLSSRHVLSSASVCSTIRTMRSSFARPVSRSIASATKVARVPIRKTVRSTRTGGSTPAARAGAVARPQSAAPRHTSRTAVRRRASCVMGRAARVSAATSAPPCGESRPAASR